MPSYCVYYPFCLIEIYRKPVAGLYTKLRNVKMSKLTSAHISAPSGATISVRSITPPPKKKLPLYGKCTRGMPKINKSEDLFLFKVNNYFFTNYGET